MSSSPLSEAPDDATSTTNKRRSGRVSRKPDVYASSPNGAKRKRDHADDEEVEDEVSQEEEESSEDEPDEEEMREKRARERKAKSAAPKKPAAKKPKSNGTATNLAIRTGQGKKRAPKRAKALDSAAAEEAGGLYGALAQTQGLWECITDEQQLRSLLAETLWRTLRSSGYKISKNLTKRREITRHALYPSS